MLPDPWPGFGEEMPDVLIFDSRPGVLLLNGHFGAPASVSPRSCGSFWPTSEGLGGRSVGRLVVAFDPEFVLDSAHILTLRSSGCHVWKVSEKTQLLGVPGRPVRGHCSRNVVLFVSEAKIQGHLVTAMIFWDNISMSCYSFPWTTATTFGYAGSSLTSNNPSSKLAAIHGNQFLLLQTWYWYTCGMFDRCSITIVTVLRHFWPEIMFKFTILLPANLFRSGVSVNMEWNMLRISGVLAVKISNLCLQPMVFAAQGLKYQRWNNILSVGFWSKGNMTSTIFKHQVCSHTTRQIHGQRKSWSCLCVCKIIRRGNDIEVRYSFFIISAGTVFYLPDDHLVEDAVLSPFGLCHQRWTTTPLLLIPRFNGGDPLRLSSVMVPQNLQLNPPQPRVHTPDRPLGEPPTGHQLVWSMMEALEDCRCSNIESVLSTDERSLFGFIGNLLYQLQVFRSSFFHFVRLGTFGPSSTLCRQDILYYEL